MYEHCWIYAESAMLNNTGIRCIVLLGFFMHCFHQDLLCPFAGTQRNHTSAMISKNLGIG